MSPAGSTPASGEWHHVAYVYRNDPISTVEYFVDGVSVGSRTTATTGPVDTANGFAIGTIGIDGNGQFFHGMIDDLRIYNVELTVEEIGELLDIAPPLPLAIESIAYDGTTVDLTWVSQPGKQYLVSRSLDNPAENFEALRDWEELVDSYPLGGATGSSTSYSDDTLPAGTERAFYRVEEMPPN